MAEDSEFVRMWKTGTWVKTLLHGFKNARPILLAFFMDWVCGNQHN